MRITPKSLSVVVPVHNAERNLAHRIGRLLEVLPDLAAKFEVLIVDDGSTDQTEEVAFELSQEFPQVRVTRHQEPRGIEASVQTGAAHTTGDIVIVHAGHEPVNASQLHRMWQHREDEELVVAPVGSTVGGVSSKVLRQLEEWGNQSADYRRKTPAHGARPTRFVTAHAPARTAAASKRAVMKPPRFRFSSPSSPSSMHQ